MSAEIASGVDQVQVAGENAFLILLANGLPLTRLRDPCRSSVGRVREGRRCRVQLLGITLPSAATMARLIGAVDGDARLCPICRGKPSAWLCGAQSRRAVGEFTLPSVDRTVDSSAFRPESGAVASLQRSGKHGVQRPTMLHFDRPSEWYGCRHGMWLTL